MEITAARGASRSDLGNGRGALWLFLAVVGLLQPVAGKPEVCQCDFGSSAWEDNMTDMIEHIGNFGVDFPDGNHMATQFIRNYKCPKDAPETDWKCRPEQSAVSVVCSLQALCATTRRLIEPGTIYRRDHYYDVNTAHYQAVRQISLRFAEAVKSETLQQRRVCEEQRVSAEKVTAQQKFEARRAEAQAREEAKKAEAEDAQRSREAWQARAEAAENELKRAEASAKRAEQLLKEAQAKEEAKKAETEGAQRSHEAWQARAEAAEDALQRAEASAKRAEQLIKEAQAKEGDGQLSESPVPHV
ncbi:unnamed protein product [Symbiodinium sp. CCMP2592]|nr:unnamed protein product [Symbiodinium sp. CCMP2592]